MMTDSSSHTFGSSGRFSSQTSLGQRFYSQSPASSRIVMQSGQQERATTQTPRNAIHNRSLTHATPLAFRPPSTSLSPPTLPSGGTRSEHVDLDRIAGLYTKYGIDAGDKAVWEDRTSNSLDDSFNDQRENSFNSPAGGSRREGSMSISNALQEGFKSTLTGGTATALNYNTGARPLHSSKHAATLPSSSVLTSSPITSTFPTASHMEGVPHYSHPTSPGYGGSIPPPSPQFVQLQPASPNTAAGVANAPHLAYPSPSPVMPRVAMFDSTSSRRQADPSMLMGLDVVGSPYHSSYANMSNIILGLRRELNAKELELIDLKTKQLSQTSDLNEAQKIFQKQLADKEAQLKEKDEAVEKIRDELESKLRFMSSIQENVIKADRVHAENSDLKKKLETQESQLRKLKELVTHRQGSQTMVEEQNNHIISLNRALEQAKGREEFLRSQMRSMTSKTGEGSDEVERLQLLAMTLGKEKEALEAKVLLLQKDASRASQITAGGVEELKARIHEQDSLIAQLTARAENAEIEKDMQSFVQEAKDRYEQDREMIKTLEETVLQRDKTIAELQRENEKDRHYLTDSRAKCEVIQQQLDNTNASFESEIVKLKAAHETEVKTLQGHANRDKESVGSLENQLRRAVEAATKHENLWKEEKIGFEEEVSSLKSELEECRQTLATAEEEKLEKDQAIVKLSEENSKTQELKAKLESLEEKQSSGYDQMSSLHHNVGSLVKLVDVISKGGQPEISLLLGTPSSPAMAHRPNFSPSSSKEDLTADSMVTEMSDSINRLRSIVADEYANKLSGDCHVQ